ncbi:MAG: hypothetical protein V1787_06225 [Candidatus Micrarchaeota archaeon]
MNRRTTILLALLAALCLRAAPLALPSFTDPDHYYHLRIAETIISANAFPSYDSLSYLGRPHTYYPLFHILISIPAFLTGMSAFHAYAAISMLTALAGVLSISLLARKAFGKDAGVYALAFAALLPAAVIRSSGVARPDALSILLLPLLAISLLEGRRAPLALLGFLLPLLHPLTALFACGVVAAKFLADLSFNRMQLRPAAWFGIPLLAGAAYYLRFPLAQLRSAGTFLTSSEMQPYNFEFALLAFGIAWLFVAFAALRRSPSVASRLLWLWLAGSSALMLLASRASVFAVAPASVLAAAGLQSALSKGFARPAVLSLFALGLSLAAFSFLSDLGPQYRPQTLSAAQWLGENGGGRAAASFWDKGHLLTYSGVPAYMDGYFEFAPDLDARQQRATLLFQSPSRAAVGSIAGSGVRYVFADGKMDELSGGTLPFRAYAQRSPEVAREFDAGWAQIYAVD